MMREETIITEYYVRFDCKIATNRRMDQLLPDFFNNNFIFTAGTTAGTKKGEQKTAKRS